MNKTPDEIKKGLEFCMDYQPCVKYGIEECPYNDTTKCMDALLADAQSYIQQLETANAELLTRCEQLKRERDALLKDIGSAQGCICIICKNYNNPYPGTGTAECNILGRFKDFDSDGALMCGQFKWRGVKEE